METCDTIVVGLGVAGSAAALELSRRGHSVLGLDRHAPGHELGSSHGESRLMRTVYFEAPHYVRLLRRARERWQELEEEADRTLFLETGALMIGRPDGDLVSGCRRSVEAWDLACEELSPAETTERFPAFHPPAGHAALFDPRGGCLLAAACLEAFRGLARRRGARLRFGEPVTAWERSDGGITVRTDEATYAADALVLAAGGWTRGLVPERDLPLVVERQTVHQFRPTRREPFLPERFPVFIFEGGDEAGGGEPEGAGPPLAYGVPLLEDGVKVALHHGGEMADRPDDVDPVVRAEEGRRAHAAVETLFPDLAPDVVAARVCRYTNTPDEGFLLDRLPGSGGPGGSTAPVVLATGFSGHGFKFAPVAAEIAADLVEGTAPEDDAEPFRLARFG